MDEKKFPLIKSILENFAFKIVLLEASIFIILLPIILVFTITDKKKVDKIENSDKYLKENILVLNENSKELEYFVYEKLGLKKDEYYSLEDKTWYSINPKVKYIDEKSIVSDSIFPLDFYLTPEEKEKESFTLAELEVIKQRILEKDATLTRTQN